MFTSLRKRPDNVTDEQLIQKFKLMMHFQGSGTSTDKDYKEFHDVCELIKIIPRCTPLIFLIKKDSRDKQRNCELSHGKTSTKMQ